MDSSLNLLGLLTADALVLASDTPTLVKAVARLAKVVYGGKIQICSGVNDEVNFAAAIATLDSTSVEWHTMTVATAEDGGVREMQTLAANDAGTDDDMDLLPATPAGNDAYYFGGHVRYDKLRINVTTPGEGVWTITWEYWDGSSWSALAGVSDGTTGFKTGGSQEVSWTMPSDWKWTTVNDQDSPVAGIGGAFPAFYVRARVSAYTSIITQPLGGRAEIEIKLGGGRVQFGPGKFSIAATTLVPTNVHLNGAGDRTRIKIPDATPGAFAVFESSNYVAGGGNYGIEIADMLIDVNTYNSPAATNKDGTKWDQVDYSELRNLTILNAGGSGGINNSGPVGCTFLKILNNTILHPQDDGINNHEVSFSTIHGNHCRGSQGDLGLDLDDTSCYNTLTGNVAIHNKVRGIFVGNGCRGNVISGNVAAFNQAMGIQLNGGSGDTCEHNVVIGNVVYANGEHGIRLGEHTHNNLVIGNVSVANGQEADDTWSNIDLRPNCDWNALVGNLARKGAVFTNRRPKYGIDVSHNFNNGNVLISNDLYASGQTGDLNDAGTATKKHDNRDQAGSGWIAEA